MMILRLVLLLATLYAAWALIRRNQWTIRERQALVVIAVATAIIAAAAVALLLMQDAGNG